MPPSFPFNLFMVVLDILCYTLSRIVFVLPHRDTVQDTHIAF